MTITIYGASDDLVEVSGCEGADKFNIYSQTWTGDLAAPDGSQMRVYVRYEDNGCWSAGVSQVDEDHPLGGWAVTITQAAALNPDNPGYSALLTVDAPDGTRLTVQDAGQ